jgi:hypothetical protein
MEEVVVGNVRKGTAFILLERLHVFHCGPQGISCSVITNTSSDLGFPGARGRCNGCKSVRRRLEHAVVRLLRG